MRSGKGIYNGGSNIGEMIYAAYACNLRPATGKPAIDIDAGDTYPPSNDPSSQIARIHKPPYFHRPQPQQFRGLSQCQHFRPR